MTKVARSALEQLEPTHRLGPWHPFTAAELEPFRGGFEPRKTVEVPFDRDRAIERAKASRVERDGRHYNDNTWAHEVWENDAVGREEARFWLGLCANTPFLDDAGPQEDLGYIDDAQPLDAAARAVDVLERVSRDPAGQEERSAEYYWLAVFFGEAFDYAEALDAVLEAVHPESAYPWITYLGPPPPEHWQHALDRVDELLESRGSDWFRGELAELLAVVPHPKWIARRVEQQAESGFIYMETTALIRRIEDPELFRRLSQIARDSREHPWEEDVMAWVARFGADDIEGLFELVLRRDPSQYWEPVYARAFEVRSPDWVAVLEPLASRHKAAPIVEHYLRNEGVNAVEGLLRLVDSRGKKRLWALDWIEELARDPARRVMIDARLPEHPKVSAAVLERLADDGPAPAPVDEVPGWAKTLMTHSAAGPAWLDIDRLTAPILDDGGALDPDIVRGMLTPKAPPPKAEDLQNPGELAWSVVEQWRFDEERASDAIRVFGALATEHEAAKLGALLRSRDAWPPSWQSGHEDRQRAISALAAVDLAGARRELANLAELHAEDLRHHVRGELGRLRQAKGWSEHDFDDLSVPTLGLDARGERTFDYGSRTIRLSLRGKHDLVFVDESTGKEYARLPTAKKADDPARVQEARDQWALLKGPLVEVFDEQSERFERAMVAQRPWALAAWRERLLAHHLVGHIVRRLVWIGHAGNTKVAFRWSAEDDAHDVEFDGVEVEQFESLTVAHPAMLDVAKWTELFAELEIIQPFDQVGRPVYDVRPVEPGTKLHGRRLADAVVAGGWDISGARWYRAPLLTLRGPDDQAAVIELRWGVEVSATRRVKPQQMDQDLVEIRATRGGEKISLDELHPALRSELFGVIEFALM